MERLELSEFGVTTQVESFKRSPTGGKADHFAVVQLFSARNKQHQVYWEWHLDALKKAVTTSLVEGETATIVWTV